MDKPASLDRLFQFTIQWYNLIFIVGHIQNRSPIKVATGKVYGTQFQFPTSIIQLSQVPQIILETGSATDRTIVKQIFRIAIIIFQADKNTIDKCQVESQIQVIVLFPFKVRVR